MTDDEIKRRLRLRYVPSAIAIDTVRVTDYERFLALSTVDQHCELALMSDEDFQVYLALSISRAEYEAREEKGDGSITEDRVAKYPERYRW